MNIAKMLPSTARLSQCVTMTRIRGIVNTGCMADQQLVANSQNVLHGSKVEEPVAEPKQKEVKPEDQHADADSAVWRDRISAKIKMAATPEARSLNSL